MADAINPERAALAPTLKAERKRKLEEELPEVTVDISLPEPPSKKAKRLEKKSKSSSKPKPDAEISEAAKAIKEEYANKKDEEIKSEGPARSDYGIWASLSQFLKEEGKIAPKDVLRVHMPAPADKQARASNKGFAYVDFSTQENLDKAMGLSEYMLGGRRVLIKNAKSFAGRPEKKEEEVKVEEKEPSKRVFVGNLNFDVTKEDLEEHFSQVGELEDVFMATFQDTGKCKGFAWIRFHEAEDAANAVRGWVYVKAEDDSDSDEVVMKESSGEEDQADAGRKKKKAKKPTKARRHKKHVNELHGRPLRLELAEDPQTRYKKRYGKDAVKPAPNAKPPPGGKPDRRAPRVNGDADTDPMAALQDIAGRRGDGDLASLAAAAAAQRGSKGPNAKQQKMGKEERRDERRKRHDARNIAPGQALANTPRASGAIVEGKGKKISFD
ncbi:Nucleolar protein 13 [Elasticomyces elasticus]|nr:Nucleolar protein 13 [Elasticomyces elasticus]